MSRERLEATVRAVALVRQPCKRYFLDSNSKQALFNGAATASGGESIIVFRISATAMVALILASCGPPTGSPSSTYSDRLGELERLVERQSIGPNGDYWLIKTTYLGSDAVGLVFGFPNNGAFCQELADAQNELYPGASVSCRPAQ